MIELTVVIPTYNRRWTLARTLPTILEQRFPPERYEVIVAVDGSTDGTLEALRSLAPRCAMRLIEQGNRGQAAARNAGARAARGRLLLFLDDDILCGPTLISEHVAAHQDSGPLVAFGPVLVSDESPATLTRDLLVASKEADSVRFAGPDAEWPMDAMVAANSSVPRATFLAHGGFDERLFRSQEDVELGLRLWKAGVPFRRLPGAVTRELYVKSAEDLVRTAGWWCGQSEVLVCRKHPEFRRHSTLARVRAGPLRERLFCELSARSPIPLESVLRPPLVIASRLRWIPWARRAGMLLLRARRLAAFFRSARCATGSWRALREEFGVRLPVLLYHHIGPRSGRSYPGLTVSPRTFERQIGWLACHGYTGIRPSDWLAWCREGRKLPARPILITLDDAYADIAVHALPVLWRHGFSAGVFVVSGHVGGSNVWDWARGWSPQRLMSADEIRHWTDRGIEFGSHGREHRDLTQLVERELESEVQGSLADLTALLGQRPIAFAYPFGRSIPAVEQRVREAYELAFGSRGGLNDLRTDTVRLRRAEVAPGDSDIDLGLRVRLGWHPRERVPGLFTRGFRLVATRFDRRLTSDTR